MTSKTHDRASTPFLRTVFAGMAGGAAGTTALNAVTYLDMLTRGRPSSDVPEQVVEKIADRAGVDIPGPEDMPSALPSDFTEGPKAAKGDRITLFVAPQNVSPGERINFNGVYTDGEGARLQVQRKEGGAWVDFPVEATVRGGSFETWIQTSRTGVTKFRVFDAAADRASNVVTVTIG